MNEYNEYIESLKKGLMQAIIFFIIAMIVIIIIMFVVNLYLYKISNDGNLKPVKTFLIKYRIFIHVITGIMLLTLLPLGYYKLGYNSAVKDYQLLNQGVYEIATLEAITFAKIGAETPSFRAKDIETGDIYWVDYWLSDTNIGDQFLVIRTVHTRRIKIINKIK